VTHLPTALTIGGSAVAADRGALGDLAVFATAGIQGRVALSHVGAPRGARATPLLIAPGHLALQIDAAAEAGVDAVKIGPLPTSRHAEIVAARMRRRRLAPVVLAPGRVPDDQALAARFRAPWLRFMAVRVALVVLALEDEVRFLPTPGAALALVGDGQSLVRFTDGRERSLSTPGVAPQPWSAAVVALLAKGEPLENAIGDAAALCCGPIRGWNDESS
jgi:hydroxymethylpyrimidine/phosphomethylpyrimidine kinase